MGGGLVYRNLEHYIFIGSLLFVVCSQENNFESAKTGES